MYVRWPGLGPAGIRPCYPSEVMVLLKILAFVRCSNWKGRVGACPGYRLPGKKGAWRAAHLDLDVLHRDSLLVELSA